MLIAPLSIRIRRAGCDDVSHGRTGPAQLQDASNRQANDDESADEHTDRGQLTFTGRTGFAHSGTELSSSGSLLHSSSFTRGDHSMLRDAEAVPAMRAGEALAGALDTGMLNRQVKRPIFDR